MNSALTIHLAPILPEPFLYAMAGAIFLLFLFSLVFYRSGIIWRLIASAAFLAVMLNPSIIEEERKPVSDIAAIIVDRSPSQSYGERTNRTDEVLAYLQAQLEKVAGLEVRVTEAPLDKSNLVSETKLFNALDNTFGDVPVKQRAGAIFITDGQIHDIPQNVERLGNYGPIHALLTGKKNERDRQIVITEAPAYGIVGQTVTIRYRIEDTDNIKDDHATVVSRTNNQKASLDLVPTDIEQTLTVTIDHAGQNIVDIQASAVDDEITQANNRVPLIINGVRDRLRVLLVSGQPHAGGRTWRNLLTADPGVDLVHFTILREPNKLDATPQNELSLIAFPFRELFEIKLYEFDLIIFDRYRLNRILPNYYFANIANYVKEGGALLEASGPSFASNDSVYTTALQDVLPAYPTGQVFEQAYKPHITDVGLRHPVTEDLKWREGENNMPGWGAWLRQVAIQPIAGNTLMSGVQEQPLLVLNRVGKGRVAQLATDQIWLWSRGYDGGGPQAELLRRLAHWLMKEPELEEHALLLKTNGNRINILRRSLKDIPLTATLTKPDGASSPLQLTPNGDGYLEANVEAEELGIYTVDDGTQKRFAVIGDLNPPELSQVITTEEHLKPAFETSHGGALWLSDNNKPAIRLLAPNRDYSGSDWLALRKNKSYVVSGVKDTPFMPTWFYALMLIGLLIAAWWFEGRGKKA